MVTEKDAQVTRLGMKIDQQLMVIRISALTKKELQEERRKLLEMEAEYLRLTK